MTIYLATVEGCADTGGVHLGAAVRAAGGADRVVTLVSDLSLVHPRDLGLAMRPEQVAPEPGDILVVTGAERFPAHCAEVLAHRMPLVASSMASLAPVEAEGARRLDLEHRAALVSVRTEAEWPSFAIAVGLPVDHPHEVVGNPRQLRQCWETVGARAADRVELSRLVEHVLGAQRTERTAARVASVSRPATVTQLTPNKPLANE